MASIKKRGDSWRIFVSNGYHSDGKKIVKTKTVRKPENMTDKKWEKELERIALEFEIEVEKGLFIDSNITLAGFTERWLEEYAEKQMEPKTIASYKDELNSKILPALGHIKLSKLTPVQILSFLNNLLEDGVRRDGKPGGYSNKTVKYQWQILSSILQQAVYWQIIPDNICKRVKCPKNNTTDDNKAKKIKFLDENQTLMLLDLIKDEQLKYQLAVNIAIFCGLRNGEILGLTWDDVDFENKTLNINKARTYIAGEGMFTKSTKTENSNRVLSIPDILIRQLREYKLAQNTEKVNCGDQWSEEWDITPWLLTTWNGEGMHYNTLTNWLLKLLKRHNKSIDKDKDIPVKDKESFKIPVVSFHKLRHTSATLLIGQNMDIKTVSTRLGHSQTSTTMNIYVHGLQSGDERASNALENLLDKNTSKVKRA